MRAFGKGRNAAIALCALLAACGGEVADSDDTSQKEGATAQPAQGSVFDKVRVEELEKKARAALETGNPREAARLIENGLSLSSATGEEQEIARGRFLLLRGNLARDEGRTLDARRDYADAMALFRVAKSDRGRFEVFIAEAALEEIQGDYAAAERQLEEAEEMLSGIGDDLLVGAYKRQLGRLAFVRARYEDACALYAEALKSFTSCDAKREQGQTLLLLAVAEDGGGDAALARRTLDKALKTFEELGDKDGQVRTLHRLAGFAERDGQTAKARTLLTKVRALYEELGRHSDAVKVEHHLESLPEGTK